MPEFQAFTPEERQEARIKQAAEATINATLSKHNISRESLPESAVREAHDHARAKIEQEDSLAKNPYYLVAQEEKAKREQLEREVAVLKSTGQRANLSVTPTVTAAQAKARIGEFEWNHRLTDAEKLGVLQIAPEDRPSRDELKKLFGRGASSEAQTSLHKANPRRYAVLREAAIALGCYGAPQDDSPSRRGIA